MSTICSFAGCNKPVTTGKYYCSKSCAAKDRGRMKELRDKAQAVELAVSNSLSFAPDVVKNEVICYLLEEDTPKASPTSEEGITYGDWVLTLLGKEYRPSDRLSYETIEQMLRSGLVMFAFEMKRAEVLSVFRSPRGWKVVSPNKELREVTKAALEKVLPKMMIDLSFSSFAYGVSFQELLWEHLDKYALGLSESKNSSKLFTMPKVPNSINPRSITNIIRDKDNRFNGFEQNAGMYGESSKTVIVDRESALVVPFQDRFRNLYGYSMFELIYPYWVWYEVILRSMVRYMERMGTPIAVVRAPSRGKSLIPGTNTREDNMIIGLRTAATAASSNAMVIPSDRDDSSGEYLWDISYLSNDERSQPFIGVLETLTQAVLRSAIIADNSVTSSGTSSNYNVGMIHANATALHNEELLTSLLHYVNKYFMPKIAKYNLGNNAPPMYLETQGLDHTEREFLMKMFNIVGNNAQFSDAFMMLDWRELAELNSLPTLTEEEVDALKKKLAKEALDKQNMFMKQQASFAKDKEETAPKENIVKVGTPVEDAPVAGQKEEPKVDKSLEEDYNIQQVKSLVVLYEMIDRVKRGERIPLILGEKEINDLKS